ncbi:replication initiator protein A [Apilactobacillus sp. TMW 2.2459]|uniref:replication initiator protein A n=1 Tax=Apilactobacillus xinyiensis TaxID=2841032 RepID=UPI00200EA840|nr:replication initiator protein A [Apilactobacillus xinyiensis]MCL0312927.1 replication initiator protein A [Apilactobacillus xinyiensis]
MGINEPYFKSYLALYEKGLNPSEVAVYGLISNRMNLSMKNNAFYDVKSGKCYVIYSYVELAKTLNLGVRTIAKIMKKLVNMNLIETKRQFDKPNKIFINDFTPDKANLKNNVNAKCASMDMQNMHIIKTDTIKTDITDNTVNTGVTKSRSKEINLDHWEESVHNVYKLPYNAIKSIRRFTKNNSNQSRLIVGLISKARSTVAKKNHLENTPKSQFETNQNIQDKLSDKLNHVFMYIKQKNLKEYSSYLVTSLKEFFEDAFGLIKETKTVTPKMQTVKFNNRRTIKETLPAWAEDNYKPSKNDFIPKKELNKRIKELKKELSTL